METEKTYKPKNKDSGFKVGKIILVSLALIVVFFLLRYLWNYAGNRKEKTKSLLLTDETAVTVPHTEAIVPNIAPSDLAAYVFCYPLVLMNITREYGMAQRNEKFFNQFSHQRERTPGSFEAIPAPNNALVYSSAWVELPIKLKIPVIQDRYVLITLLDWYGNVRWRMSAPFTEEVTFSFEKEDYPDAVWLLSRIFSDGEDNELPRIHEIQDSIQIEGTLVPFIQRDIPSSPPAIEMVQLTPKEYYEVAQATLQVLSVQPTGITHSLQEILSRPTDEIFTQPSVLCCTDRVLSLKSSEVNGWTYSSRMGDFGEDYMLRAFVARWLFTANREIDTHYFFQFNIDPAVSYQLIFDSFPQSYPLGFWSFSLYNQESKELLVQKEHKSDSILSTNLPPEQKNGIMLLRKNPLEGIQGSVLGLCRVYAPRDSMVGGKPFWFPPALVPVIHEISSEDYSPNLTLQM